MVSTRQGADLQIGEVAERTGVTQRTLRFYEERGLLKPPSRMEGGFRLYSEEDVQRVEQIKGLQRLLGLSLAEIKEMVEADEALKAIKAEYRREAEADQKIEQIRQAREITEKQYTIVHQKLEQLQTMSDQLEKRRQQFDTWLENLELQRRPAPSTTS
jgi:MerR family transcriptional regulator, repressor of the yfmOP operon